MTQLLQQVNASKPAEPSQQAPCPMLPVSAGQVPLFQLHPPSHIYPHTYAQASIQQLLAAATQSQGLPQTSCLCYGACDRAASTLHGSCLDVIDDETLLSLTPHGSPVLPGVPLHHPGEHVGRVLHSTMISSPDHPLPAAKPPSQSPMQASWPLSSAFATPDWQSRDASQPAAAVQAPSGPAGATHAFQSGQNITWSAAGMRARSFPVWAGQASRDEECGAHHPATAMRARSFPAVLPSQFQAQEPLLPEPHRAPTMPSNRPLSPTSCPRPVPSWGNMLSPIGSWDLLELIPSQDLLREVASRDLRGSKELSGGRPELPPEDFLGQCLHAHAWSGQVGQQGASVGSIAGMAHAPSVGLIQHPSWQSRLQEVPSDQLLQALQYRCSAQQLPRPSPCRQVPTQLAPQAQQLVPPALNAAILHYLVSQSSVPETSPQRPPHGSPQGNPSGLRQGFPQGNPHYFAGPRADGATQRMQVGDILMSEEPLADRHRHAPAPNLSLGSVEGALRAALADVPSLGLLPGIDSLELLRHIPSEQLSPSELLNEVQLLRQLPGLDSSGCGQPAGHLPQILESLEAQLVTAPLS